MKIKLKTLSIMTYDINKKENVRFVTELKNDQLMRKFVPGTIEKRLLSASNDSNIEIGSSYIINENKNPVGYVRFNELEDNVLTLHYGVHPDKRKQGYGSKILLEVSDYVFKNMNDINKIRLCIRSYNVGSRKCALNAGFIEREDMSMDDPVIYFKTK